MRRPGNDLLSSMQDGDARADQRGISVRAGRLDGPDDIPSQSGRQLTVIQRVRVGGVAAMISLALAWSSPARLAGARLRSASSPAMPARRGLRYGQPYGEALINGGSP
jgi:hypothetical protein